MNNAIFAIAIDKNGDRWFGTQAGISRFNGSKWTNYTTKDGLTSNKIYSAQADKEGNVWFGTLDWGVNKFDGRTWSNYTPNNTSSGPD